MQTIFTTLIVNEANWWCHTHSVEKWLRSRLRNRTFGTEPRMITSRCHIQCLVAFTVGPLSYICFGNLICFGRTRRTTKKVAKKEDFQGGKTIQNTQRDI